MDLSQLIPYLFGLGLLLCLSGFFSGSETALCALTKVQIERLRKEKNKRSSAIVRFVDDPRRLFITILLGNTFVNIAFATITAALLYELFGAGPSGLAIAAATFIITLALLIFGEVTPKTYAIRHAERFSRTTGPLLWKFSILITPLRAALRVLTNLLLPLFGGARPAPDRVTPDDLRGMVDALSGSTLHPDEEKTLERILQLTEIQACEIMVPQSEMAAIGSDATVQQALDRAKQVGHSRLPVYRQQLDNLCGVFHVKDWPVWRDADISHLTIDEFLAWRDRSADGAAAGTLVRAPYFVHETKNISSLLSELSRGQTKMAVLLDEWGGVAGIVTMEDIVEEIVGEIRDEHDVSSEAPFVTVRRDNPRVLEVAGRTSLRRLNRQFGLQLDEEIADTAAGYVLHLFGRVPEPGESISDERGIRFQVAAVKGLRVSHMTVTLPSEGDGHAGQASVAALATSAPGAAAAPLAVPFLSTALLAGLALRAFYAGSETALVSANAMRIRRLAETGNRQAAIIRNLQERPDQMLAMTLVGTNLMSVVLSQVVLLLATALLGDSQITTLAATVSTTSLILVFGEIIPKTVFRMRSDELSLRFAYPLRWSELLFGAPVRMMTLLTEALVRLAGKREGPAAPDAAREELRLLATLGEQSGGIMSDQRRMIHGVLDLKERTVGRVMVPLVDFEAVEEGADVEAVLRLATDSGTSRIPVYSRRIDNVVGVVNVLDLILSSARQGPIRPFVRKDVLFVPESKKIGALLQEIQGSLHTMVFAVDEYGGIVGLATVEDLVEEIVGELWDERDEADLVRVIGPRVLECDGRTEIDVLADEYGVLLPTGEYETIAGYILAQTGSVPSPGDALETGGITLTVTEADVRAVRKVRIRAPAPFR